MHAGGALAAGVCALVLDATIAAAKQIAPLEVEANCTDILLGLSVVAAIIIPAPAFVSVRWFRWPPRGSGSKVRQKLRHPRETLLVPFEVLFAP
jgi:hypothetical protein